jgi:hypothetical protein
MERQTAGVVDIILYPSQVKLDTCTLCVVFAVLEN